MSEIMGILADPQQLKRSAQTIDGLLHDAMEAYQELGETVKDTESCFKGRSADRMRKRLDRKKEEGIDLLVEMMAFPVMLSEIAEEYISAERDNKNAANRN